MHLFTKYESHVECFPNMDLTFVNRARCLDYLTSIDNLLRRLYQPLPFAYKETDVRSSNVPFNTQSTQRSNRPILYDMPAVFQSRAADDGSPSAIETFH